MGHTTNYSSKTPTSPLSDEEVDRIFYSEWPNHLQLPPVISAGATALWLDDTREAPPGWDRVYNAHQAIVALDTKTYEIASLDHDLEYAHAHNEQTGLTVVDWMVAHDVWPSEAVYVHSWNPVGSQAMCNLINRYGPYKRLVRPTPAISWPD